MTAATPGAADPSRRNLVPTRFETSFNRAVGWLTAHGVSVYGSRVLAVRGRTSGEWRTNPVNPLTVDGHRYLVAPRGHTQWVRNLRVAGTGEPAGRTPRRDLHRRRAWPTPTSPTCCAPTCGAGAGRSASSSTASARRRRTPSLLAIAPGYPVFAVTTSRPA
ncbi:nitroreductase [Angustibacter aerolatus]|uniref:Nitroreductase n=1 Tax=Angustibacter aerolatus TaxID=1162965 RepID=A0ABQ6JJJ3_9ACTN|nr:nitroreductase/quinone reductase family protein [Angustibacter aerolatus]GMA87289.1 nitroreductase [Angustibacter aerolatus]